MIEKLILALLCICFCSCINIPIDDQINKYCNDLKITIIGKNCNQSGHINFDCVVNTKEYGLININCFDNKCSIEK